VKKKDRASAGTVPVPSDLASDKPVKKKGKASAGTAPADARPSDPAKKPPKTKYVRKPKDDVADYVWGDGFTLQTGPELTRPPPEAELGPTVHQCMVGLG
jgi:hypothetical protein